MLYYGSLLVTPLMAGYCYMAKQKKPRAKKEPIVIPNAENLTPEELKKAKHAEKMRRYMARRNGKDPGIEKKTNQELRTITTEEMVSLAAETRNVAIQTLFKKLQMLNDNPELLEKVNIASLSTVFGTLVDKSNLLEGKSTQNIAIQAKIDVNMSSDEAIQELNKMREKFQEDKSE